VDAKEAGGRIALDIDGKEYRVDVEPAAGPEKPAVHNPLPRSADITAVEHAESLPGSAPAEPGEIRAGMAGVVLAVRVSAGDRVERGDVLLVVEAMKMENEILASRAAEVKRVVAGVGDRVAAGDLLCVLG